jgi:DNA-binding IclR family transcriptional regulator
MSARPSTSREIIPLADASGWNRSAAKSGSRDARHNFKQFQRLPTLGTAAGKAAMAKVPGTELRGRPAPAGGRINTLTKQLTRQHIEL